ncbi:putative phage tail protein [Priestia megaterium]|uniref:putative phage tail protein n=1 Tax=Priestia megaterium TaxID=1404 RepID=UPI001E123E6E|nr:putative phage tail protein [Priestia megaterium]CAH0305330.1 hypothetical protein SRABI82_04706 [Priestia megaterium]
MAELLFGQQLNLNGMATTQLSARGLFRVSSTVAGSAAVSATKLVGVVSVKAGVSASAATSTKESRLIKYVGSNPKASATASGKATFFKTIKADLVAGAYIDTFASKRDVLYEMKDYLPHYYRDIREAMRIIEAEAKEFSRVSAQLEKVFDQYFVNTADVALDRWETALNITPDPSRSLLERRQFINAKLRGAGTTTIGLLNNIVDSFCEADITELADKYEVNVKTTGRRGIPKNFSDIEEAVNDVIPAHIKPSFAFSYVPWSEIEASAMMYEEADTYEWEELQSSYPQPPSLRMIDLEDTTQADTDTIQFKAVDTRLEFD